LISHNHVIFSNIEKHIDLTSTERDYIAALLNEKFVNRKNQLLRAGDPCKAIYFVTQGAVRAFYQTAAGKEATIMFAIADWWITDMPCFISQSSAMISIEAIEDSEVLELQKNNLDLIFDTIPKFERFFRILMQNAYVREQLRVLQNLSLSAAERYHNFITKYPTIAQQVAQKDIASYLGITPEFLSSIRSKKLNS
jgi:CRP-like cAMP-binding protein